MDRKTFGRHIRSLRGARGLSQEVLAERSGLSPDTIRRLERGGYSPGLKTLSSLCHGLGLRLSTFFEAMELGGRDEQRELTDLLATRSPHELELVTRVVRALLEGLDAKKTEPTDD